MPSNWTPGGNPINGLRTLAQRTKALALRRADFDRKVEGIVDKLYRGDINYKTWERYMRSEIRAMHTAALIYSRGGDPKSITKADLASLNTAIRDQYKYLRNWSLQARARAYLVETGKGDFFSRQYMINRAKLYGGAAGETFYRMFAYDLLPQVPRDGNTQCLTNCKCVLEFKQGEEPEVVLVYWNLMPAEHCPDCIRLSQEWNPYVLRLPEGLSAHDWVTWLPTLRIHDNAIAGGPGRGWWGPAKGGTHKPSKAKSDEHEPPSKEVMAAVATGATDCFNHTKSTGNEAAAMIGADGRRIGFVLGQSNKVDQSSLHNYRDEVDGIDIHSHPNRSSFSDRDIEVFSERSATRHSIVISSDGTIYRMSKPPGWEEQRDRKRKAAMEKAISSGRQIKEFNYVHEYDESNRAAYKIHMRKKSQTKDDWWEQSTSDAAEALCKKLGLIYSKEILPGV